MLVAASAEGAQNGQITARRISHYKKMKEYGWNIHQHRATIRATFVARLRQKGYPRTAKNRSGEDEKLRRQGLLSGSL
jgi:hypothetical protein